MLLGGVRAEAGMIDTSAVAGYRTLKFNSPDEVLADVDRLVAAEKAGTLRSTGKWTLGQNLGHLAAWMDFPFDGYPKSLKAPWLVRAVLKLRKKKYLYGRLPRGVRIPGQKDGTVGTEVLTTDEGAARYRRSWERLRKSPPPIPNPVFGPMTHEEWIALHCRHAELHLGYLHES
jgi:hypothetical protein